MGQTERDEDEIRVDLFFLPFILYHPYFILALTATAIRYATGDGPRSFLFLGESRKTSLKFSHRYLILQFCLKSRKSDWHVTFFRHLIIHFYCKEKIYGKKNLSFAIYNYEAVKTTSCKPDNLNHIFETIIVCFKHYVY